MLADGVEYGPEVELDFHVDDERVRARLFEGADKGQGVLQHQVRVEFEAGSLAHGRDDWQSKADVGDEVSIHYVEMKKISSSALDAADVLG